MMIRKLTKTLFLLILCVMPFAGNAACYTEQDGATLQNIYITPPELIVQRDASVGQVLWSFVTPSTGKAFSCTTGNGTINYIMNLFTVSSGTVSHAYQTNIPGVSVIIDGGGGFYVDNPARVWSVTGPLGINLNPFTVSFVKTGPITSGQMSSGTLAKVYGDGDSKTGASYILSGGLVTQVACSINTPTLTFPIGDILASSFGSSIGTVPSGAQNTQNLGLNCDPQANINVTLTGEKNNDVAINSVLALTGQGTSSDVASGVGVQILYNNSPIELNQKIVLKQSSGGQETFPLTARYYQTRETVSTGTANASATLNLTYQ